MKQETKYPDGRELYYSKCSACHRLYNPDKYTEAEWDSILASMEKKAKLNKKQKEEIYHWIIEIKAINEKAKPDN